ncbi:hypothetical protein CcI49_08825 [Frankia sp. CcI49]|uniref:hypothetical protein n=1 Tax=Frankia sp. CcI49 TaxID=1745382 RepID=UPI000977A9D2|nr:hypothetical protein [Frankia sp. CcI49]ONH60711.1 hypothetical protein CcI49_08825 [Frankia sp. CcI49]
MANVHIYPEHQGILNGLVSTHRVASHEGRTETGPFNSYRDAYVFAASLGVALNQPTSESAMPTSKRGSTDIHDTTFLDADGARELVFTVILLQGLDDHDVAENGLRVQLERIADTDKGESLALLDRYAYAGFEWLKKTTKDVGTTRELVMEAIDKVVSVDHAPVDFLSQKDPLLKFLM